MASDLMDRPPESPERQAEILRAALTQTRINLVIVCLLLAAVIGVGLYVYFASGRLVEQEEQGILEEARKQVSAHSDQLLREAGDLAEVALPPFVDAFTQQIKEDFPTYVRRLEKQGEHLGNDLTAYVKQQAKTRYRQDVTRGRAFLKEEFPKVTDPQERDRMMKQLEKGLDRVAERYYADEFQKEFDRLGRIWKSIPPAEVKGSDRELMEQLTRSVTDWVGEQLQGRNPLPATQGSKESKGPPAPTPGSRRKDDHAD